MGLSSAFKSAWDKASDAVKQKVAEVAVGAKKIGAAALDKAQQTAQKAQEQAEAAKQFVEAQASKAANKTKQAYKEAEETAKTQIAKAVEKAKNAAESAKQNARKALDSAKQSANKAVDNAKQNITTKVKEVKDAFSNIKTHFSENNRLKKPISECPYGRIGYTNVEDGSKNGKLKLEGEAAAYKFKKETDVGDAEASVIYGKAGMSGARVGAEVGALKISATNQEGDDPLNPTSRIDTEIKLASAEAKGDFLVGYDTRRVGISLGGSFGADLVSTNIKSEIKIPFFFGWSISIRGSIEPPLPTIIPDGVGAGAGGHGYYDIEEKRVHAGGFAKLKVLKGFGLGLDISIGQKYTTKERKADW